MTIVSRITVPAIAAGLLLSGCGGSDGTTAAQPSTTAATSAASTPSESVTTEATPSAAAGLGPAKPRGSKLVVDKANGYQLALPSGYIRITSKSQLAKVAKSGASAAARAGVTQQLLNKSLKMIAISSNATDSINVVVTSAGGLTAEQLPLAEPELKKQVAKLGAKSVAFKELTLGGDPALRAIYTLNVQNRKVLTVQYITVHDEKAYTLTFSQPARLSAKTEKQTAGSWRFL
jgi:hypothetical protein